MLAPPPPMSNFSPSKRQRRDVSGSIRLERDSSDDFLLRLRSEDVLAPLRSKDVLLGGGLHALTSEDLLTRLRSAEIVKDILLPDSAATAAAAVTAKAGEASKATDREEKIGRLRAKLERNSTGDDLVPLNMKFRITSGDWIKDFETDPGGSVAVHPSLFLGNNYPSSFKFKGDAREGSTSPLPFKPWIDNFQEYSMSQRSLGNKPPSLRSLKHAKISSSDWIQDFKEESVNMGPMDPSLFVAAYRDAIREQPTATSSPPSIMSATHLACHPPSSAPKTFLNKSTDAPSAASATNTNTPPSASAAPKKKKKKNRKRMLDETTVVEPNEGDVLSGRGGFTNTHPGNVRFRQKALEFRPWYEESSKEKKQEIADLLVDFVKNEGNRFLGKGKDGQWHEMIGKGPHYKASQALRERI